MYEPISQSQSLPWRLGTIRVLVVSALLVGCGGVADPMTDGPDAGDQVDPPDAAPDPDPDPDPNDPDAGTEDPDAAPDNCAEGHTGPGCLDCDTGYQDGNGNGVCAPSCEATGDLAIDCGAHGACDIDADTGLRFCGCDAGYGGASCELCTAGYEAGPNSTCILDLPSTLGMTLWLDADATTTIGIGTGKLATWKDRRGGANPITVTPPTFSASPSWVSNGMNGRGVVRFDGDDDLRVSSFTGLNSSDYTLFMVFSPVGTTTERLFRLNNTEFGTAFVIDRVSTGNTYRMTHRSPPGGTGGDAVQANFANRYTDKLLVLGRATSGALKFMRLVGNDGGDLQGAEGINATLTNPNLSGLLSLRIGDASVTGDMAEIIIYNRLLSVAELKNVQEYLAAKWNLE